MTLKYFLTLIKTVGILVTLLIILNLSWNLDKVKEELKQAKEEKYQEQTVNRYRIDQVSKVVLNIANQYPAVGQSLTDVLVSLKEDRMIGIDQKISDLPEDMQDIIIHQNIDLHGLEKYIIFDNDYQFPTQMDISYIPAKYGEFGWRPKLFDEKTYEYVYQQSIKNGVWILHDGNDIVCKNPEVQASNDGLVVKVENNNSKNGNYIVIEHRFEGKPLRQTRYHHLSKIEVKEGQYVKKGEIIGYIGNTGMSTSSHLHFSLREYDGKKWIYKNAFIGTTHNRKWMGGYFYQKDKEGNWKIKVI